MLKVLKIISGLIAVLVLAITVTLLVQVDFSDDQDLNRFIEAKMEVLEARGLAVAFIEDGGISWPAIPGMQMSRPERRSTMGPSSR